MNPVKQYYINQAGTGLTGFAGARYQRGNGWLSNIWSNVGLPVLKFLGKQALSSGLSVASDALEGKNIKESALSNLRDGGKSTVGFLKNMTGSGRRRRKGIKRKQTRKKRPVVKKKRKRKRR